MAEIKVEKKQPVWPWVLLGLIILGVILYFLLSDRDDDDMDTMDDDIEQVDTTYQTTQTRGNDTGTWPDDPNNPTGTATSESVNTYITHVGNTSRMGVEHEYTNNALIHLINAVDYKAQEQNVDINTDLAEIRNDAREITENPQATDHANHIKSAATKIADAMEKIQEERFPNLSEDVEDVRTAAQEIDTTELTLDQKDRINSFFKEAAEVLKKMS